MNENRSFADESLGAGAEDVALVFKLIEEAGVGCGYERSVKFVQGAALTNRFMLGVESTKLSRNDWLGICRKLGMPGEYVELFASRLDASNLVLLGFEDGGNSDRTYKVYLEFWDQLQADLRSGRKIDSTLLHIGFKWKTDDASTKAITEYTCYPKLSYREIEERIDNVYQATKETSARTILQSVIAEAKHRCGSTCPFIYLEVQAGDASRHSFDINLYPAAMRMRDIEPRIVELTRHFSIATTPVSRWSRLVASCPLGHVSGGFGTDGTEFATVYYESEVQ